MAIVRRSHLLPAALVAALAAVASPGCASPSGRVYVHVGPPAPIVEARVAAPGPGYVWLPGYYRWNGAAYVWAPGRWERPVRPSARWVPGHWVHEHRGWYFAEGHWR
ncbi:MAG TPA: hypothetical protein VH583_10680 [Vicinamibacterales bacterium]|jgi:hypothetical protein